VDVITGSEIWPHVTQSEGQIAVHGSTVVVVFNDTGGIAVSPRRELGLSVSTNGGASFTRFSPSPFVGPNDVNGQPFVVYNKKLGLFFAGGIADWCGGYGFGLWTSVDGLNWAQGYCAHTDSADDRPSMAVDNTPTSPYYGRMYLSFNNYNQGGIFCTYSDNGMAWTPVQLTPATFIHGLRLAVA